MTTDQAPDLEIWHDGALSFAAFSRPTVLNALRYESLQEIVAFLQDTAKRPETRVVIITGRGRAFCAGQDLNEYKDRISDPTADERGFLAVAQAITDELLAHPAVTMAAINGVAVGFGAEIAVACDLRVIDPSARLGFVEAKRAMCPTNGVTWLLPRLIGHAKAIELLLTGDLYGATDIERLGLASRITSAGACLDETIAWARTIAEGSPLTIRLVKNLLRQSWVSDASTMMDLEVEGMLECLHSHDSLESTNAFLEKRKPVFIGR